MKKILLMLGISGTVLQSHGQSHRQELSAWQHEYKAEFMIDANSPLRAGDTAFLRFYPVSQIWQLSAEVVLTPDEPPFDMATHSGKTKRFRPYALLKFRDPHSGRKQALSAYERVDRPPSDTSATTTLFMPFQDRTNGTETYGGGRYIDLKKSAIINNRLLLDFNKAYNPYCVFKEGYSCPIPPAENRLSIPVKAGEMLPAPPLGIKE